VDTSVWVDFFNGHRAAEAEALARLIADEVDLLTCGVVATEVLQGIRRRRSLEVVTEQFVQMEWLTPQEPGTYLAAADLFAALRRRGVTIRSTVDCIIATLADEGDAILLAKDRDMRAIVTSGLLHVRTLDT
jgi:predicted nucleic acid-binding protein